MHTLYCRCCGRDGGEIRLRIPLPGVRQLYGLPEVICTDCLVVWYEEGLTDPEEIAAGVLGSSAEEKRR